MPPPHTRRNKQTKRIRLNTSVKKRNYKRRTHRKLILPKKNLYQKGGGREIKINNLEELEELLDVYAALPEDVKNRTYDDYRVVIKDENGKIKSAYTFRDVLKNTNQEQPTISKYFHYDKLKYEDLKPSQIKRIESDKKKAEEMLETFKNEREAEEKKRIRVGVRMKNLNADITSYTAYIERLTQQLTEELDKLSKRKYTIYAVFMKEE